MKSPQSRALLQAIRAFDKQLQRFASSPTARTLALNRRCDAIIKYIHSLRASLLAQPTRRSQPRKGVMPANNLSQPTRKYRRPK